MSICKWCETEMQSHPDTCTGNTIIEFPDGTKLPAMPYTPDYGGPSQRCHDCGIAFGGFHHPGCDMERCPKCPGHWQNGKFYNGQLISCGCLNELWEQQFEKDTKEFVRHIIEDVFKQELDMHKWLLTSDKISLLLYEVKK